MGGNGLHSDLCVSDPFQFERSRIDPVGGYRDNRMLDHTGPGRRLQAQPANTGPVCQASSVASIVMVAFNTFDTGQFSLAVFAAFSKAR